MDENPYKSPVPETAPSDNRILVRRPSRITGPTIAWAFLAWLCTSIGMQLGGQLLAGLADNGQAQSFGQNLGRFIGALMGFGVSLLPELVLKKWSKKRRLEGRDE